MNVMEALAQSAKNRHGRTLSERQVQELVTIIQAMQMQIANDQGRLEAQTRILTVALEELGGDLLMPAEDFANAQQYIIDVEWDEEGDTIHASIRLADVGVPEVQDDGAAASGDTVDTVPLHAGDGGDGEDGEADADAEGEVDGEDERDEVQGELASDGQEGA
jgi:hypothetical protein